MKWKTPGRAASNAIGCANGDYSKAASPDGLGVNLFIVRSRSPIGSSSICFAISILSPWLKEGCRSRIYILFTCVVDREWSNTVSCDAFTSVIIDSSPVLWSPVPVSGAL